MTRSINEASYGKVQQLLRRLTEAGLNAEDIEYFCSRPDVAAPGIVAVLRCVERQHVGGIDLPSDWYTILPGVMIQGVSFPTNQSKVHHRRIDGSRYNISIRNEQTGWSVSEERPLSKARWEPLVPGWEVKGFPGNKLLYRQTRLGGDAPEQISPGWEATFEVDGSFDLRYSPR